MLQLIEVLGLANGWDDDAGTIYAERPWSPGADTIIINPAPDMTNPVQQGGRTYDYFLEAFIAREFLDDFAQSAEGSAASGEERCNRLIRYALDDA